MTDQPDKPNRLVEQFCKYVSIGVLNTLLHWVVFLCCYHFFSITQAWANLIAFICAASFSFIINARFTFKKQASPGRYIAFMCFMGLMSFLLGKVGDALQLHAWATLILFSAVSLVLGFVYSRLIVFRS